jgi:hypothetical protein
VSGKDLSISTIVREASRLLSAVSFRNVSFALTVTGEGGARFNAITRTTVRQETAIIHLTAKDLSGLVDDLSKKLRPHISQLYMRLADGFVAYTHTASPAEGYDTSAWATFNGWRMYGALIGLELRLDVCYSRRDDALRTELLQCPNCGKRFNPYETQPEATRCR